jgi:hypothetical protein
MSKWEIEKYRAFRWNQTDAYGIGVFYTGDQGGWQWCVFGDAGEDIELPKGHASTLKEAKILAQQALRETRGWEMK